MALGGKKRALQAQRAAGELERKLDNVHSSKAERELARGVFRQLSATPEHPPWNTIVRRAMGSVVRSRKSEEGLPIKHE